jgi:predicted nucleic-acid-binding protein
MRGFLVDTNIFLRLLTEDDTRQTPAAKRFFTDVIGKKTRAYVTVAVILELVWTLESYYELARADVSDKLSLLLNTGNLTVENSEVVEKAIEHYESSNADFIDCYNAAFANLNGDGTMLSYDRHFDKLADVIRTEP